jgi:hypothetical protein
MKKVLLLILLCKVSNIATAQSSYCKDIKISSDGTVTTYESPTPGNKKEEVYQLGFIKKQKNGDKTSQIFFKLGYSIPQSDNKITDASITFQDGDILKFSNLNVKRSDIRNLIDYYLYSTLLPLTTADMLKFKTKKIKAFTFLGETEKPGFGNPAVKIMAYANCLAPANETIESPGLCDDISRTYNDMKYRTDYLCPTLDGITISKAIVNNPTDKIFGNNTFIDFSLLKNQPSDATYDIYVKFEDGQIFHSATATATAAGKGQYNYEGYYTLNASTVTTNATLLNAFKTKRIVKYQIADTDYNLDPLRADKLKQWLNCIIDRVD